MAIRKAVGPGIRVEANQSWNPQEAVRIINMMEEQGVQAELVEQPVKANDLTGLKFVTQHVQTPIVADESVFSAKDALHIIQTQSADLINIKLGDANGIGINAFPKAHFKKLGVVK